jgi:hypothetical protein
MSFIYVNDPDPDKDPKVSKTITLLVPPGSHPDLDQGISNLKKLLKNSNNFYIYKVLFYKV